MNVTAQGVSCIFLDRDGVINRDRVNYAYRLSDFEILPRVPEALRRLKTAGYRLVIVTNQSGIAKGIYTREQMETCHDFMNMVTGHLVDKIYYAPYHPSVSESLTRKPDSLMFERAIAKFNVDPARSWMIGDKERDLIPARKLGIPGILIDETHPDTMARTTVNSLWDAAEWILRLWGRD
jgi:D-glycero-D-manno-heptose 1,7-bisphosphate phosphatase